MSNSKEDTIYGVDFGGKNFSICSYKKGEGCKVIENAVFSRRTPYLLFLI